MSDLTKFWNLIRAARAEALGVAGTVTVMQDVLEELDYAAIKVAGKASSLAAVPRPDVSEFYRKAKPR